jgi:penicillin-binding protein 1C
MPGHSGRLTAAPVLFKIADLLGPGSSQNRTPPPEGALLTGRNSLPPRLQRLEAVSSAQPGATRAGPKIVYPPDGALIEWRSEELPLEAVGGKPPLRWLIDGKPLPATEPRRPIYWQPEGPGFAHLAVIDGAGRSAHSTVRLAPD